LIDLPSGQAHTVSWLIMIHQQQVALVSLVSNKCIPSQKYEVVFADSRQISRIRRYSGVQQRLRTFAYRAVTFYGSPFQSDSASTQFCNSAEGLVPLQLDPTTPVWQRHQALTPHRFGVRTWHPLLPPALTYFRTLHGTIQRMKQANLKATFHSPATTVPLRTTATRSMLPICLQTAFAVRFQQTNSVGTAVHENVLSVLRLEPAAVSIQRPDASSYLRSPLGG
jgi:hypothetical protein